MTMARVKDTAGFCLPELMIAMAAGAVVLAASVQTLDHFDHRFRGQQRAMASQQDLRIGLGVVQSELRIAHSGSPLQTGVLRLSETEVEFMANLNESVTTFREAVSGEATELPVRNGGDWSRGKTIHVCTLTRCAEGRLARDGRVQSLTVSAPLGQAFPAGSLVSISNRVRYYLRRDPAGTFTLMRMVDGGASALFGEVVGFRVVGFDRSGYPTQGPTAVARLHLEVMMRGQAIPVTTDIGLRSNS